MSKRKIAHIKRYNKPYIVLYKVKDGSILNAIIQQARVLGWNLLDLELTKGGILKDTDPIGVIIGALPTDPIVKSLTRMNIPIVRIGNLPHPKDHLIPVVLPDQFSAGCLAVDHFLEKGFQNLAHIGSRPWSFNRQLHGGFMARAREMGRKTHLLRLSAGRPADTLSAKTAQFGHRADEILHWVKSLPKPIGILAPHDHRAAIISVLCNQTGIKVPDEVALLGYGNNEINCELAPVAISSIDAHTHVIGHQAACLLQNLIEGAAIPSKPIWVAPSGVVSRRSTDVFAVSDPLVAKAMRFIWDHYEQDLSVYDIAREAGALRHQLERAFRKTIQCGVHETLLQKRLTEFEQRLLSTDELITDIALKCGFRTMANLHKVFKARYGMPPRDYRTQHQTTGS